MDLELALMRHNLKFALIFGKFYSDMSESED